MVRIGFLLIFMILMASSCGDKPQPYSQKGEASYYARMFEGEKTASGAIYSETNLTAAHNTLPLGTVVKVTNIGNNKSVTVEINDRGPYAQGRIIDLSRSAAKELGMMDDGTAEVYLEVTQPAEGYTVSDSVTREE